MPNDEYTVAFDATPLAGSPDSVTSHTMRGIGRYIGGLLDAVVSERRDWAEKHLRPVITRGSVAPGAGRPIVTRRLGIRPQDTGWWTTVPLDRVALGRRHGVSLWHVLDPNTPLSPLPPNRTVMTAYDLIPLHEPQAMAQIRPHRRPVYGLYVRRLQRARLVLAISKTTAADLVELLNLPAARVRVVYPAVRMALQPPAAGKGPTAETSPDLLFVGVPDPTKQAELAIAALAECRRRGHAVRLRFAGYQRPSDRAMLDSAAAAEGVLDSVDHLGRIPDADLRSLYRTSVLLAVSRIEGFGLPAVESLFAGGRVVCGSAPAYREVVGDAAEFAAALDGPGLADAYEAAVARSAVGPPEELIQRYSPSNVSGQLIDAYEAALAG